MAINQVSTANTFQEWVNATSALIGLANNLTDGTNTTPFIVNSKLDLSGVNASLNVRNSGSINSLYANTANIANVLIDSSNVSVPNNLSVGGNIAAAKITTTLDVGSHANISGDLKVSGNVLVSGNITLDEVGFDDLSVAGSANIANSVVVGKDLRVDGSTLLAGDLTVGNLAVGGSFTGAANTAIYAAIAERDAIALAYSIALG